MVHGRDGHDRLKPILCPKYFGITRMKLLLWFQMKIELKSPEQGLWVIPTKVRNSAVKIHFRLVANITCDGNNIPPCMFVG